MSSVTLNSYNIPSIFVLVDSGSSNCFIDTTFVNEHAISTYSVPSIQLWLFDRTMNTTINYPNSQPLCPFQNWWHHSNDILCYSAGWLLFTCSRTQLACLLQSINWLGFGQYLVLLIWIEHLSTPELSSATSRLTSSSWSDSTRSTTKFLARLRP